MRIYKVKAIRESGLKVNFHVGANSVNQAINSVFNCDSRVARIDKVVITNYGYFDRRGVYQQL